MASLLTDRNQRIGQEGAYIHSNTNDQARHHASVYKSPTIVMILVSSCRAVNLHLPIAVGPNPLSLSLK